MTYSSRQVKSDIRKDNCDEKSDERDMKAEVKERTDGSKVE